MQKRQNVVALFSISEILSAPKSRTKTIIIGLFFLAKLLQLFIFLPLLFFWREKKKDDLVQKFS